MLFNFVALHPGM